MFNFHKKNHATIKNTNQLRKTFQQSIKSYITVLYTLHKKCHFLRKLSSFDFLIIFMKKNLCFTTSQRILLFYNLNDKLIRCIVYMKQIARP